jgi:hypothetical protein
MTYDKVKIIFEKDGEEIVKGEVLARDDADLTADYLLQNFWTMHKSVEYEPVDFCQCGCRRPRGFTTHEK